MADYEPIAPFTKAKPAYIEQLNKILNNQDFLFENRVQFSYKAFEQTRTNGLKLAAGITPIGPSSDSKELKKDIRFGNFFTPNSTPIVNATHASNRRGDSWVAIRGLGEAGPHPTSNGFMIVINLRREHTGVPYPEVNYIHWSAIGY